MLPLLGAAISGGLSLLSGFGSQKSAKSQQRRQLAMDEENRRYNQYVTDLANSHNEALGRELADVPVVTHSRVDVDTMMQDAQRAGFNPVTWLQSGALQAYTQSAVTGANAEAGFRMMMQTPALSTASQAVNIPNALSIVGDAGQAALKSYQTDERLLQSQAFQERMLGVKLNSIQQGRSRPPGFGGTIALGTSGSYRTTGGAAGGSGTLGNLIEYKPQEVTPSVNGWAEPGPNPTIQYFNSGTGWVVGPGDRMKQAMEDDWWQETGWNISHKFLPSLGFNLKPPNDLLYGTERWVYNPLLGEYQKTTEPRASRDSFNVKVTPVDPATPNGLTINGYQVWPPKWW